MIFQYFLPCCRLMGKYLILLLLNGIGHSRNYFFTQCIICESCIQSSSQIGAIFKLICANVIWVFVYYFPTQEKSLANAIKFWRPSPLTHIPFFLLIFLTGLSSLQGIYRLTFDDFYIYKTFFFQQTLCVGFFGIRKTKSFFQLLTCSFMKFWYSHRIISQCLLFHLLLFFSMFTFSSMVVFLRYLLYRAFWFVIIINSYLIINENGCDSSGMNRSSILYLLEFI